MQPISLTAIATGLVPPAVSCVGHSVESGVGPRWLAQTGARRTLVINLRYMARDGATLAEMPKTGGRHAGVCASGGPWDLAAPGATQSPSPLQSEAQVLKRVVQVPEPARYSTQPEHADWA